MSLCSKDQVDDEHEGDYVPAEVALRVRILTWDSSSSIFACASCRLCGRVRDKIAPHLGHVDEGSFACAPCGGENVMLVVVVDMCRMNLRELTLESGVPERVDQLRA